MRLPIKNYSKALPPFPYKVLHSAGPPSGISHYGTGMEVESKNLQTYRNLTILYLLNVVMKYLD